MARRRTTEERVAAIDLFDQGFGAKRIAKRLGIPESVVEEWSYTCRALGKEALLSGTNRKYTQKQKIAAVLDVVDGGLTAVEAMEKHGVRSVTQIKAWRKAYEEGGAEALAPKPKGRPKARREEPRKPQTELERLRAENERLRCELEVQKRLNALAERKRQGAKRRK